MVKPGNTGITRVIKATGYSWQGLKAAWQHESAFRQECMLAVIMFPMAFYVGNSIVEVALLICTLGIVLIAELANSAIEAIVDRVGPEHHELSGRAKDIGSAAVFVSLFLVVVVWGLIGTNNLLIA